MAKSTKKTSNTGPLAGKTVAFVGKFGYRDGFRKNHEQRVVKAGGKVVDVSKTVPDYLVAGEGRGGKPPSEVAKLKAKSPAIEVLEEAELLQFFVPDREELLREISKGRRKDGDKFWEDLHRLCFMAKAQIDLTKADLKNANLFGANLEQVDLSGSDLRGANVQYTEFGDLENVRFDGCNGENVYLRSLTKCSFRNANLEKTWMFYGRTAQKGTVKDCDFTSAKMTHGCIEGGVVRDCKFVGADLRDAEMEESVFERTDFSKADMSYVHAAESRFDNSIMAKANLTRADLRDTSLAGVDLRNANLRGAVLSGANLSGANIAGADFQDAVFTGTNLKGIDFSKAKNFKPPVLKKPGPKLLELAAAAAGAKEFITSAEVTLGEGEFAKLLLIVRGKSCDATSVYHRGDDDHFDRISAPTLEKGILNLADRWPTCTLRLDTIEAKGSKSLRGQKLQDRAVAAWSDAFDVPVQSPEELKAEREDHQATALRERDALVEKIRKKGPKIWNDMNYIQRDRVDLRKADLSGAKLGKLEMMSCDLKGANFTKSSLVAAEFGSSQLTNALFTGANLQKCQFHSCNLIGANFRDADLTATRFNRAKLMRADFTGATLKNTIFTKAQFDETTIFPSDFKPPDDMLWKGEGLRPGGKKVKAAKAGSLDFETFLKKLNEKMETERMKKAGSMLKAERFQLFAEVKDDVLLGIVKSQTSKDLVYSCRLASDGAFGCCTQNLRPCGGLRGALCKHLLVLVIGLAKAGQLDSATVDHWINLSKKQKPAIDEESMSATFLKYKGAESGEIDWRPTETIPEDFYAM